MTDGRPRPPDDRPKLLSAGIAQSSRAAGLEGGPKRHGELVALLPVVTPKASPKEEPRQGGAKVSQGDRGLPQASRDTVSELGPRGKQSVQPVAAPPLARRASQIL